jgi:hypothetical protein
MLQAALALLSLCSCAPPWVGGRVGFQPGLQQHEHKYPVAGQEEIRKDGRGSKGTERAESNKGEQKEGGGKNKQPMSGQVRLPALSGWGSCSMQPPAGLQVWCLACT